jgi:hypothetical protein
VERVCSMHGVRNVFSVLVAGPNVKGSRGWEDNIKVDVKCLLYVGVIWMEELRGGGSPVVDFCEDSEEAGSAVTLTGSNPGRATYSRD